MFCSSSRLKPPQLSLKSLEKITLLAQRGLAKVMNDYAGLLKRGRKNMQGSEEVFNLCRASSDILQVK